MPLAKELSSFIAISDACADPDNFVEGEGGGHFFLSFFVLTYFTDRGKGSFFFSIWSRTSTLK